MAGRNKNYNSDNSGFGCLLMLIVLIFAMPLVGIYLIVKGNENEKTVGWILLILGMILWIYWWLKRD